MDLGVRGRGYLIVGGTSGMGYATAAVLAAEGARVVVAGRDAGRAQAAARRIRAASGDPVGAVAGDVGAADGAETVMQEAVQLLGGLDGVAITTGTGQQAHQRFDQADDAAWSASFEDVLMGTVRTVRAALPHLVAAGGGTIVTTAAYSIRAYHPARVPYVTLKSGVAAFTKTIAREYGRVGIRANCVCPGAVETGDLAALRGSLAQQRRVPPEGLLEQVMTDEWHMDVALGRLGTPQEVAELYAFLLSRRAGYLTGAVVNIDGGTEF